MEISRYLDFHLVGSEGDDKTGRICVNPDNTFNFDLPIVAPNLSSDLLTRIQTLETKVANLENIISKLTNYFKYATILGVNAGDVNTIKNDLYTAFGRNKSATQEIWFDDYRFYF